MVLEKQYCAIIQYNINLDSVILVKKKTKLLFNKSPNEPTDYVTQSHHRGYVIVTTLLAECPGFESRQKQYIFPLPQGSDCPWELPNLILNGYRQFFYGSKAAGA